MALALPQRPPAGDPIPHAGDPQCEDGGIPRTGGGAAKRGSIERVGPCELAPTVCRVGWAVPISLGAFRSTERLQHSAPRRHLRAGNWTGAPCSASHMMPRQGLSPSFKVQGSQAVGCGEHNLVGAFAWTAGRGFKA